MCEWGTDTILEVVVPARLSSTGQERRKRASIDSCIAPLVNALNGAEILTVASCCGHFKRPGNIALADGRELIVAPDYETARQVDKAFPPIFAADSIETPHE